MASAAKYAHEETGDADRPLKVCAEAGRKCVKNIHQYPILSVGWIALVDSLKQLTRLVQLESRMPVNSKASECAGRDKESDGTLWDQEAHETAIRILVEEAKVNLCLRMMNDFKKWQYNAPEVSRAVKAAVESFDYTEGQIDQKLLQFEESLGLLLARAFMHVETLQLMDIPLLIEHCALVFEYARNARKEDAAEDVGLKQKLQENLVLHYFCSLMKHAEALNNSELLAKTKELHLVHFAADHALRHLAELLARKEDLFPIAEGFACLCDNEDFKTNWQEFFAGVGPEAKTRFLELESIAQIVLTETPERRKELRPLLDFFKLLQRNL